MAHFALYEEIKVKHLKCKKYKEGKKVDHIPMQTCGIYIVHR